MQIKTTKFLNCYTKKLFYCDAHKLSKKKEEEWKRRGWRMRYLCCYSNEI